MNDSCSAKRRIILHVDMDHFFSAVEEREHPEYRGKPVIVGADPENGEGRGVVKTCNYPARGYGVHSGMPVSRAWRLCPDAVYVRANYPLYKEVSQTLMEMLRSYADRVQQWGLDEAFLDVSSQIQDYEAAVELAQKIKRVISAREHLTCSIGIGPNKLVAKIASDHKKPDGLTAVSEACVARFLAPLPVRRLIGVGKKAEAVLNAMGIRTIGDLAALESSALVAKFGKTGAKYHEFARGIYDSEVAVNRGMRKSVGHEKTFMVDATDHDRVLNALDELCQRIHQRIVDRNMVFRTVTVKIRFENFETHTHGKTLQHAICSLKPLQKVGRDLAQRHLRTKRVRLVGVRVSNLTSSRGQKTLL